MKYAIVEISGRQFWIETGKYYDFNKVSTELGKHITLNRILLIKNGNNILIGKPYLKNVEVNGIILKHFRGKKTIIYKMRPKKKTRKKHSAILIFPVFSLMKAKSKKGTHPKLLFLKEL